MPVHPLIPMGQPTQDAMALSEPESSAEWELMSPGKHMCPEVAAVHGHGASLSS